MSCDGVGLVGVWRLPGCWVVGAWRHGTIGVRACEELGAWGCEGVNVYVFVCFVFFLFSVYLGMFSLSFLLVLCVCVWV